MSLPWTASGTAAALFRSVADSQVRMRLPEAAWRRRTAGCLETMSSVDASCYSVAMDLGVCQLRNFSMSFLSSLLSADGSQLKLDGSSSGASVVAIDNKIEQAMDLVKSHLMYAVREEVEVLKEQIKTLIEQNSQLEQENTLLKKLASPEQMAQFQAKVQTGSPPAPQTDAPTGPPSAAGLTQPATHSSGPSA